MVKKEEIISVDFRGSSALPRALFPRTIFKYSVCMYGVWDMYVKVGRMAGNRLGNNLERLWGWISTGCVCGGRRKST